VSENVNGWQTTHEHHPRRSQGALLLFVLAAAAAAACGGSARLEPSGARDAGGPFDAEGPAPAERPGADGALADGAGGDGPSVNASPADAAAEASGSLSGAMRYVFVVAMENADAIEVYGARKTWQYLDNDVLPQAARALAFQDELPRSIPSEPHYVWMEAGTNVFADHTFTTDNDPSAWNSTGTADHLTAQIARASNGVDWMSYQEGLDAQTGSCPLVGAGLYRPKHNPFVFFRDVVGAPPSETAPVCVAHHRPLSALGDDLATGSVKTYSFVTPNLCHDDHGQATCPDGDLARAADRWLNATLPALISFVNAHDGAIFIVWDEGDATSTLPFVAIGPHVKPGYASNVTYSHSSLLKTVEEMLGLPVLPSVAPANDLADLFQSGFFP
jgi:hypothetical protein